MQNRKLAHIQKDINRYFKFLFDRGFKFSDSFYDAQYFGNWMVSLESSKCIIEISSDRNELFVAFASIKERKSTIGLKPMIYFLSQGQNVIGPYEGNLFWGKKKQYQRLASLLEEYIDQITLYFGNDFQKYKEEMISAGKKYVDLLLKNYTQ